LDQYDIAALEEIKRWKSSDSSEKESPVWVRNVKRWINKPLRVVKDSARSLLDNKLTDIVNKAFLGIVSVLNDGAALSVRTNSILKEFRKKGHYSVEEISEVHNLELKQVEKVVGYLDAKYRFSALIEGAGVGLFGGFAMVADIPFLITLNLRAIGEYATYYGFDLDYPSERVYMLNVLVLSSSLGSFAEKQAILSELSRIATMAAKKKTWDEIEKSLTAKAIRTIAEKIGADLTKAKFAQFAPVLGSVVGAGLNTHYTNRTLEAAFYLYRERFLRLKHGDIIDTRLAE
jgi:hypothetical protein